MVKAFTACNIICRTIYKYFDEKNYYYTKYKEIITFIELFSRIFIWHRNVMYNICMVTKCTVKGIDPLKRKVRLDNNFFSTSLCENVHTLAMKNSSSM